MEFLTFVGTRIAMVQIDFIQGSLAMWTDSTHMALNEDIVINT